MGRLEAGRAFDPAEHTPDETTADLYWMEERLSGGRDPTAFGANNSGQGLGGSLLHWGAFCPRPDPRDLKLASETGRGRDWPFGWDELKPYVESVEAVIGVSGPADYPWGGRQFTYPSVARNAPADAMARGALENAHPTSARIYVRASGRSRRYLYRRDRERGARSMSELGGPPVAHAECDSF